MNKKSLVMLKLVERIARIREMQVQQSLSEALSHEKVQRERVDATSAQLCNTDAALRGLQACDRLDVARLGLYRDLASSIDRTLAHEQENLLEKCKARSARSSELVRATHYREQASGRAAEAGQVLLQEVERSASELRLETWLLSAISERRQ